MRWDATVVMWSESCTAVERADRSRHPVFRVAGAPNRPVWEPPADLLDLGDSLLVVVALPGVPAANVEVSLEAGSLSVFGFRPMLPELRGARIHALEIPWGRFFRRIPLPCGTLAPESCAMADGCLRIVLTKIRGS